MITITLDDAVKHLKAVVEEKGESFVYHPVGSIHCTYVQNGKPDCGVGHVLDRMGVDLVKNFEDKSANSTAIRYLPVSSLVEPFELHEDASKFLQNFQSCQDQHMTWGDSLNDALSQLN